MTDPIPMPSSVVKPENIRLVITMDQTTNKIFVSGPIHNKLLCAHLIADAFKCIMDQPEKPPLVVPVAGMPKVNGN